MSETIKETRTELVKKLGSLNLNDHLRHNMGTEHYHRATIVRNFIVTDGIMEACEKAQCYWVLDILATEGIQIMKREDQPLIFAELKRPDLSLSKALLIVSDGNNNRYLSKVIEFTTFEYEELTMKMADQGDNTFVACLPSED
jgi:hypothetical protein